jgi:hypothetical protein
MSRYLNRKEPVKFSNTITKYEFHTYHPRSENFSNNDEVRIVIQNQDLLSLPSESYIRITGKINAAGVTDPDWTIVRNGFSYLFNEVRYEIDNVEIDRNRDVGITSTLKGYLTIPKNDFTYAIAGWTNSDANINYNKQTKTFGLHIPLKYWLGFAEDYNKVLTGVKQELILRRSTTDVDVFKCVGTVSPQVQINKITWHVPHINVEDQVKLELFEDIRKNPKFLIPFRKWELQQIPLLRESKNEVWTALAGTGIERPRYVVLAFHTDKREKLASDPSKFDHCDIRNITITLNGVRYPYDAMNIDIPTDCFLTYEMYSKFQGLYYGKANEANLSYAEFLESMIYVFDVSKQDEKYIDSNADMRIDLESKTPFPANTRGYCLVVCDALIEVDTLNRRVRKLINIES